MSFHSKAQLRKFIELHKQGKIGLIVLSKWALATENIKDLPEHKHDGGAE